MSVIRCDTEDACGVQVDSKMQSQDSRAANKAGHAARINRTCHVMVCSSRMGLQLQKHEVSLARCNKGTYTQDIHSMSAEAIAAFTPNRQSYKKFFRMRLLPRFLVTFTGVMFTVFCSTRGTHGLSHSSMYYISAIDAPSIQCYLNQGASLGALQSSCFAATSKNKDIRFLSALTIPLYMEVCNWGATLALKNT
jgi:hypothetical protein